jgi:hypothetical protein
MWLLSGSKRVDWVVDKGFVRSTAGSRIAGALLSPHRWRGISSAIRGFILDRSSNQAFSHSNIMSGTARFLFVPLLAVCAIGASAASFYPQPNPSDEEQYILELINAARAHPAGEGQMLASLSDAQISYYYTYYGVDRGQLITDFAGYAATASRVTTAATAPALASASRTPVTNGPPWARTCSRTSKIRSSAMSA